MADATSILNEISGALDGLAAHSIDLIPDDRSFLEMWGWNLPAMGRLEFADFIRSPRDLIQKVDPLDVSDVDLQRLLSVPARIQYIRDHSFPQLPGGNAGSVYVVVQSLVESLSLILEKYASAPFDVQALADKKILPAHQLKALRTMQGAIERLGFEERDLADKVAAIRAAHEVAEALPADVQTLEDARERYEAARTELGAIAERSRHAEAEINAARTNLADAEIEAQRVVERANAAYSAATTVGLGLAFAERAKSLTRSTIFLGCVLILALIVGGTITFFRVQRVQALMMQPDVNFEIMWLNVTLTALSVSAPVWLAWLATRQIGQRFRLAEDYSYKATVAKAYEGYRAEASVIDAELSKKLFGIALDRLGEPPLRLIEKESPGSPAHEVQGPIGRFFGWRERPASSAPAP